MESDKERVQNPGFYSALKISGVFGVNVPRGLEIICGTRSDVRFVRVALVSRKSFDEGRRKNGLGRRGRDHRDVGVSGIFRDFADLKSVAAHSGQHPPLVTGIDFPIVIIGHLTYSGSTRRTGVYVIGIVGREYFFEKYGRIRLLHG